MSMSVKTIFKVLIGTAVVLVVSCMVVELFNISVTGMQLKQTCVMAANQAAELYTQETYKQKNINDGGSSYSSYSIAMPTLHADDGSNFVTGAFYPGTDTPSIWNGLYSASNANFIGFCNIKDEYVNTTYNLKYVLKDTSVTTGNGMTEFTVGDEAPSGKIRNFYPYLNRLYMGVTKKSMLESNPEYTKPISYVEFSTNAPRLRAVTAAKSAIDMNEDMYTPVNIGIPYFDADTIDKMFRWNLTQLLSNTMPENVRQDTDNPVRAGQYYVAYKGFRCYVADAYISELDYYIFDTSNSSDRIELQRLTGLTVKGGGAASGEGITTINQTIWGGSQDDKTNKYICVVGIKYSIPITYSGITPMRSIFEYAFRNEVDGNTVDGYNGVIDGLNNSGTTHETTNVADHEEYSLSDEVMSNDYDDNAGDTTGLATLGSSPTGGVLSSTGELYYVLVR